MSAGGTIPGPQQQNPQPQNPSLPPADYSMGYARNFQPPSFFNPFSGYYGANTGMGGFQSQFGGFQQPQFGGFGGFQQPQFGGFGGFGGGFQQPFGGGFSQPSFGNPFSRGFNPRTMPPQMRPQPMPQPPPYNPPTTPNLEPVGTLKFLPQPMPIGGGEFQPGVGNQRVEMGGGIGAFGGFQQQFNPYGNAYVEPPQQAQRGTIDQNMNNPAFKQQQDAYNMTDYQRLMQRKNQAANAPPAPPMFGMTGLGGMPIRAPSDTEIANSLGFKSPNSGIYMQTDYNPERNRRLRQQDEVLAKEYLSSIGYGQSGFDPSKYEVKREVQPFSGLGSLFSGFGRGFA